MILGLAAIAMLVGFDQLFLTFHMLSFSNDFWRLDPATDRLVQMFPQGFWFDVSIGVGVLTVLEGGLVALGGAGVLRAALPRSAFVALMIGGLLYGVPVQPASPLPWWIVEAGALAIGSAAILLGRSIWQGGPRPSRLPPLPREQSTPKGDEAQPS